MAPDRSRAGEPAPPAAPRRSRVRELHGERFEDPWFWLRDRDDPATLAYLEAENGWAEAWMAPLAGLRERLYGELVGRLKEDDASAPYPKGGWLYYSRTEAGKQHRIHCRRRDSAAPEQVLLDLNEIGRDRKFIELGGFEVSDNGERLAYLLDVTGFREFELRVREIGRDDAPPVDLPLRVSRVTSVAWAADGETLLYTVEDAAKRSWRAWRRRLDSDEESLVHEEADERFRVHVERSRSGAWIFLVAASHTASEVRLVDAAAPADAPRVVEPRSAEHEYELDHSGDRFFVRSNAAGRNFALFEAPVGEPGRAAWRLVRAHDPEAMLERVDAFARHLVLTERAAGLPRFRVLQLASGLDHVIAMPEAAYAAFPGPNEEHDTAVFRFGYQSMTTPPSVFDHAIGERESILVKRDEVPGYDPERYASERIEAVAPDGTRVPISLVQRKDLGSDPVAGRPALLRGYGSYGIPYPIGFDSAAVSLLDRGFTVAIAHVRGGGDLGKPWHDQGRMAAKANTFTDFIACAEELVRRGCTAPRRLAIAGGSAGGLLVGAVVNLRPELFGAALSYVPFVDVVNSMSDATLPLTVGEYEEWGNPAIEEQHAWMRAYSPYENLEAKAYPAMLVRTSFWDSQVMYWEPAKYVARLRTLKTDSNPLLLVTNLDAGGHGGHAGRYDKLRDTAFDYAFLLRVLGVE